MTTIECVHHYPATPKRVWALATDFQMLERVCAKLVHYEGLPQGRCKTGQQIDIMVSLFGKLPAQPYSIEVLECDDEKFILRSSEKGAGVRSWKHTLTVLPAETGSILCDHVEIDAGWMTPIFHMWARFLYQSRHKPRLEILAEQECS